MRKRDAEPLPFFRDLNGDAPIWLGLTLEHERTQYGRLSRRLLVADQRCAESEEDLALVRRAPVESGAAIDAGREEPPRPQALERFSPAVGETDANGRCDGAGEAITARILRRH